MGQKGPKEYKKKRKFCRIQGTTKNDRSAERQSVGVGRNQDVKWDWGYVERKLERGVESDEMEKKRGRFRSLEVHLGGKGG